MEEATSYHAVYLKTPEFMNWTRTHGGPYYVEVGKNIEVQYHVKVNVTTTKKINSTSGNLTVNGTTSNTTVV